MSSSMYFGSTSESKKDLMLKVAALLALVSLKNNDRVGLIIFTDKVETHIPPRKGRRHVLRLLREMLSFQPLPGKTDIAKPLDLLNKIAKKRSIVFLMSDFKGTEYQKSLEISAKRHDVVPFWIKDTLEKEFSGKQYLSLEDLETKETFIVNTRDINFQNKYKALNLEAQEKLKKYFNSHNLDAVELETGEAYLPSLIRLFKRRALRRMR